LAIGTSVYLSTVDWWVAGPIFFGLTGAGAGALAGGLLGAIIGLVRAASRPGS
jgi:hypothetical protein